VSLRARALAGWVVAIGLVTGCGSEPAPPPSQEQAVTRVSEALGGGDTAGYLRADRAREFRFPADHGPHEGYRNEWWYLTGNLDDEAGHRFGFHITFFRVALAPDFSGEAALRTSDWATRHIWMGHAAVIDVTGARHVSGERFAREAAGLAGAGTPAGDVWLEDWRLSGLAGERWQLSFDTGPFQLALDLQPLREPVLQGDAGLSQKGREPGNASYYYSVPRIQVSGVLKDEGGERRVTGQAWLDREWSTSALDDGQVGWDWFALQLDDGTDLMYYQLRMRDGRPDARSKGRWMPAGGHGKALRVEDVVITPTRFARTVSGMSYPVAWRLAIPGEAVDLRVEAVLDDQEMDSFIRYWEGAVDVRDPEGRLVGRGFVELTGYDEP